MTSGYDETVARLRLSDNDRCEQLFAEVERLRNAMVVVRDTAGRAWVDREFGTIEVFGDIATMAENALGDKD